MKHTQGEWKVVGEKDNIIITAKFLNGTDPYEMPIAYMQSETNCRETMANAQLISVAPEMHEYGYDLAMLILQSDFYERPDVRDAVDNLLSAIKKEKVNKKKGIGR